MKSIYENPSYEDYCKVKNLNLNQDFSQIKKWKNANTSSN
jgi:hypothetical protein